MVDAVVREALHRVAAHVLGRRRWEVTGRFGLRPTPGGFGTPAFGDDLEVVRLSGRTLVHERGGRARVVPLAGASPASLASVVGADLRREFSVGAETPPLGETDAPLADLDAAPLGDWFGFGQGVLDRVLADLPSSGDPSAAQLWPEHFDLGNDVAWGPGKDDRANLGASPGDRFLAEPYLYVGPWTPDRPGDSGYWNAPFGAVLPRSELTTTPDAPGTAAAFLHRGLTLLAQKG